MTDELVLQWPGSQGLGSESHNPGNPDGQWDWLIRLLVDGIRDRLWGELIGFVSHELDILITPLREIRERIAWLVGALAAVPAALYDRLASLREQIVASINYWLWRVAVHLDTLRDRIADVIGSIRDTIHNAVWGAIYWLGNVVGTIRDTVHNAVWGAIQWLGNVVGTLRDVVHHAIWGAIQWLGNVVGTLRDVVHHAIWGAIQWLGNVVGTLRDRLQMIAEQVRAVILAFPDVFMLHVRSEVDRMAAGLIDLGAMILPIIARNLAAGPPPELRALTDNLNAQLQGGLAVIQDMYLGQGQVTPERAPEIGVRGFLAASAIGFGAHVLSTAIELAHPLRYVGLHYLSGFLGQMAGFAPISYALMGTMAREAVANPFAYHIRARTRPTIPTAGELQAMRRKHNISASEFGANMAYQGYSDWWVQRFEEYLPADPRLLEIVRIADTCLPSGSPPADALPLLERLGIRTREAPDWWLEMKLALAGYNWIDIPQLKEVIKKRLVQSEYNRLIATSSVAFRRGYMEESQYRAELASANQNPMMVDIRVHAEQVSALVDDIQDLEAMYVDSFKKDLVTQDECLVALINVGLTRRKAEVVIARAAVSKIPKPTKPAAIQEDKALKALQTKYSELYRRQFAGDLITPDQYYTNLVAVGIEPRLAQITVQIELTKKAIQTRTVEIRAEEKAATAQRKVYEKLYREQFLAGVLDADGYYERLVVIGLTPREAQGTVALEVVKQVQLTRRAELKAEEKQALDEQKAGAELYVRRYRAGDITAAVLLDRLIGLGITETLAELTVALEQQKRQEDAQKVLAQIIVPALKVPFELAVRRLRDQLAAGEITPDQFLEELLASGLAEETARLILQVLG